MGAIICVSLFIEPSQLNAGPFLVHGDGRSFQIDSSPEASRGYIWVNPETGDWEAHMNPSGYLFQGNMLSPGPDSIVYFNPSDFNTWDVTIEDGIITITYDLVISGPLEWLEAAPHINGVLQFSLNEDGTINHSFVRDGFPWAEAYYYDGGQTSVIFQDPAVRGQPHDLFGIEPDPGLLARGAQVFQGINLGDPLISYSQSFERQGIELR